MVSVESVRDCVREDRTVNDKQNDKPYIASNFQVLSGPCLHCISAAQMPEHELSGNFCEDKHDECLKPPTETCCPDPCDKRTAAFTEHPDEVMEHTHFFGSDFNH